jgi:N-acetylglucosaminyl-diphospho-decaprenol L-rhamnosyltransferase
MQLSIVIICWNDWKVIENCLRSIFEGTCGLDFEVIVSDNGSTDGSVERIQTQFPTVRVVENKANLGFAKGNNSGIRASRGEYVLILNPDTIVHDGSLQRWIAFAIRHPEGGAFGCRVHNPDGSYQESARPFPTVRRSLIAALGLRRVGYLGPVFASDIYLGWKGDTERLVDWQSGCCVMFRGDVLNSLGGFDERFFYHYEEVDLCHRVWEAGYPILFTPEASITHLGGQSVGRFPIRFALETSRNRYRYFYKHFGTQGATKCRRVMLAHLLVRRAGYRLVYWLRPTSALKNRLETYKVASRWNRAIDPIAFVERGVEPQVDMGDPKLVASARSRTI